MELFIGNTAEESGQKAAELAARYINEAVDANGEARILVSTGQSQFEFLTALVKQDVDWQRVTMFHLDEYVGLDDRHQASFVRYLKERFTGKAPIGRVRFIDGKRDPAAEISDLNREITEKPIDVAFIGIGENAHIAFNDPPADFVTTVPFHIVTLDAACRRQQVREGWFPDVASVPVHAISATPRQIMTAKRIISVVPRIVKAKAIADTLGSAKRDSNIPATLLKEHPDWTLFLDKDSSSLLPKNM